MPVRIYTDADTSRWDRYVEGAATATGYHHTRWKRVMEKTFRWPTQYLLSEDGQSVVNGVLPLVTLKSRLFGHFLVSLPTSTIVASAPTGRTSPASFSSMPSTSPGLR